MARRKKTKYDKYFSPGTHRSITAFSKNAAGGSKRRKSYTERRRNRIVGIVLASVLGAAVVFTAAFFITDTLLGISDAKVEPSVSASETKKSEKDNKDSSKGSSAAPQTDSQQTSGEIRARVGSTSLLAGGSGLDSFISSLKSAGQNAVVIDFKDANGYLSYPSSIEAIKGKAPASKPQANAAQSVKKLQQSGIRVIARIYCFKDAQMPRVDRTMAVHYNKTQTIWLDNEASKGGKPWLNPYSQGAQNYLIEVIREVKALGVDCILLDGVQFPDLNSNIATFDGEGSVSRNDTLINFVNSCVSACSGTPVICAMKGEAAAGGSSDIYNGSLWNANVSAFAVDLSSLKADTQRHFPASKTVIEIKSSVGSGDKTYILTK